MEEVRCIDGSSREVHLFSDPVCLALPEKTGQVKTKKPKIDEMFMPRGEGGENGEEVAKDQDTHIHLSFHNLLWIIQYFHTSRRTDIELLVLPVLARAHRPMQSVEFSREMHV